MRKLLLITTLILSISIASSLQGNKVNKLVELYQENRDLESDDIYLLLNSLLQSSNSKEASDFVVKVFKTHKEYFSEPVIRLAIKSLVYNKRLQPALEISKYAQKKFQTEEWLKQSIQLSIWSGKMNEALALNTQGFRKYGTSNYENYLLKSPNLGRTYQVRGDIYKKKFQNGDNSAVKHIAEYYEYTGQVDKGESYFHKLLKQNYHQEVHKQSILFSYKNSHFKKGLQLYNDYKERHGIDKELHLISITKLRAIKNFKQAHAFAKEIEVDNDSKSIMDLAWIYKDYKYLYRTLWKLEAFDAFNPNNYEKLILLEIAFNKGKRLEFLYTRAWEKTAKRRHLLALLHVYIKAKKFDKFKSTLATLTRKDMAFLEKTQSFHILIAQYYTKTNKLKKAEKSFEKALHLEKRNPATHQSYIWFLINNNLNKALKKELRLLRRNPLLRQEIGFPAVVGALTLQKSDLALLWLRPLLKNSDNIEYLVVHADILDLQDRSNGANKIRIKLFKRLENMITKSPELLKDKEFASLYLQMAIRYKTPYAKKSLYFKQLKELFNEEQFITMKIGWYTYLQKESKVKYLATKHKIDLPWLNLYLAMSEGDNELKQKLLFYNKDELSLLDKVTASIDIGDRAGAYDFAFKGMADNQWNSELYRIYAEMVNEDFAKATVQSGYTQLTSKISVMEYAASYRWNLYKGIQSKLTFKRYKYTRDNHPNMSDNSLGFSLKNRDKKLLWEFEIAQHDATNNYTSASLNVNYNLSDIDLNLKTKYNNKTMQTPRLQVFGLENSVTLGLQKTLSSRIQVGMEYEQSSHSKQNKEDIGDASHMQVNASYLLRTGYPDIQLGAYVAHHNYDMVANNILPKDFSEIGTQIAIGNRAKNSIHHSWQPFGTLDVALNSQNIIGRTLSVGVAGSVKGEDSLNLMLNYSNGMDLNNHPYYGASIDYRF